MTPHSGNHTGLNLNHHTESRAAVDLHSTSVRFYLLVHILEEMMWMKETFDNW